MKAHFFAAPPDFRAWMDKNHEQAAELIVGFYKKDSGKPSITWPESVDVALCYGWIDGVRRSIDGASYCIRFTPRKPTSIWSVINIKRVAELRKVGLMRPAGLKAFAARRSDKIAIYAYEQRKAAKLGRAYEKKFRANPAAWKFFQSKPPWYRRTTAHWVISAKQEATRLRRLDILIRESAQGRTIRALTRPAGKAG
ncbi:MAG TPA: YdeI/OmpD-associated family protein [Terriglobales bacterium]|jgi:uncharacterized protein YdeI (YjbR/CyaY-like superfamily)